ncbi:hypothetical protein Q0F98_14070 [Paenibacillus amylolyticus]|nr:hypothetical protein Q0F98_14070 [Paenibacillus amylolyticus]
MGYIETLRGMVGNAPVILVRPSILILNKTGEVLLVRHLDDTWEYRVEIWSSANRWKSLQCERSEKRLG